MTEELIDRFKDVNSTLDRLLGPGGCPWDQEQTMQSLRCTVLEETCELIEAIDLNNDPEILEELGDLFLNAIFLCKLAEKEKRFPVAKVLQNLNEKLIRRHPHIFADAVAKTTNDVLDQWNAIKQAELKDKKSVLDTIPKGLPSLARAQKALKRMKKAGYNNTPKNAHLPFKNEEQLGALLLSLSEQASEQGLDAEIALRKALTHLEHQFRDVEASSTK